MLQNIPYRNLNAYVNARPDSFVRAVNARIISIPLAFLDVSLESLKTPLAAIEYLILSALNLLGVLFSPENWMKEHKYSMSKTFVNFEHGVNHVAQTGALVIIAPLKLTYQLFASVLDPNTIESTNTIHNGSVYQRRSW